MSKKYSGLTEIAYATTVGGSYTSITGKIAPDSTITVETINTDTTQTNVYGGEQLTMAINVLDFTDYATLATAMRADTEYHWRFTFVDGSTETTQEAFPIKVVKSLVPDKRTGLNFYTINGFIATDGEILTSA